MKTALNKAYPRLISMKTCVRINSIPAQETHQEASKASKVLTKSNHFIRHFELFCYYSPKTKKRKKTPSNNHYKEQFGRNYIPAMEPGLRTGILQTQVRAHHSQNHLFWKGPLMATQFLLCWIHFQSVSGILNGANGRSSFCHSCSRQI